MHTLRLASSAFKYGETIPVKYTGDGEDVSPPLSWSEPPPGTASLALVCEDPDAPRGTWIHWVVFNLPLETRSLEEGVSGRRGLPEKAQQGKNDFDQTDYGGPAPPPGKPHRYFFRLYALDSLVNLPHGANYNQVQAALSGHVLGEGELMGKYQR